MRKRFHYECNALWATSRRFGPETQGEHVNASMERYAKNQLRGRMMSEGKKRLLVLEDIEAIKTLKAWYAECADSKYTDDHQKKLKCDLEKAAWQQAMCFTEDAEWDAGTFGILKGRDALYESFRAKPFRFTMHMYTNPRIEVTHQQARAKWLLYMMATNEESSEMMHLCGYTEDEYRKIDGRWFFSKVKLIQKFFVPISTAWSPET